MRAAIIDRITRVYTRRWRDNGQVTTYVEWVDSLGQHGRTEGSADNTHMAALIARGQREGIRHEREAF